MNAYSYWNEVLTGGGHSTIILVDTIIIEGEVPQCAPARLGAPRSTPLQAHNSIDEYWFKCWFVWLTWRFSRSVLSVNVLIVLVICDHSWMIVTMLYRRGGGRKDSFYCGFVAKGYNRFCLVIYCLCLQKLHISHWWNSCSSSVDIINREAHSENLSFWNLGVN